MGIGKTSANQLLGSKNINRSATFAFELTVKSEIYDDPQRAIVKVIVRF